MSLIDSGQRVQTLIGINAKASDAVGTVVIQASSAAITDFGWDRIFSVAERKLATGNFTRNGDTRFITVHTEDCE